MFRRVEHLLSKILRELREIKALVALLAPAQIVLDTEDATVTQQEPPQ